MMKTVGSVYQTNTIYRRKRLQKSAAVIISLTFRGTPPKKTPEMTTFVSTTILMIERSGGRL